LERSLEIVRRQGHDITLSGGVLEYVLREGWSPEFGARPLQQAALRALGGAIVPQLLEGEGKAVKGRIDYDRRTNRCQFISDLTI
jgi:ATP-dependent Clp protease ATP-binding subunit ClpA